MAYSCIWLEPVTPLEVGEPLYVALAHGLVNGAHPIPSFVTKVVFSICVHVVQVVVVAGKYRNQVQPVMASVEDVKAWSLTISLLLGCSHSLAHLPKLRRA